MERKKTPQQPSKKGSDRDQRLKSALKANMARRKAQARARADSAGNDAGSQTQDTQEE